jgi:hypothetical protein
MALERMGYGTQLVAHGLRSIASTILNEQGFDPDLIEAALAHVGKMKFATPIIVLIILSGVSR